MQSQNYVKEENGIENPGILSNADEKQIWEWNQTPPETINTCAHYLIETQALSQPESPAVCSWDGNLTYGELEYLSSCLATYLISRHVGPEVLVPLCFEKSKWTVVAMLAVLKTGGAFVPLDPTQPIKRLEYIIEQTGANFVLSSMQHAQTCGGLVDFIFAVDADSINNLEQRLPIPQSLSPKTVAYVIFTSGSTGAAKGVIIEHRQLSTSSMKGGKAMGFESKPRTLQYASYVFDACILEIITTLIFGGCVCVPSDWQRLNGIANAINEMRVTCAFFTPSLLSNLRFDTLITLDTVILGGESIPLALVKKWTTKLRVILAYGPTECCVICFTIDTRHLTPSDGDIGRAISGRAWITEVDNPNVLAPIGTVGELLIEGPILARGYLNDGEKTKAAFIENPEWMPKHAPCRLYRTGDLVKYNNEEGIISFVGRIDQQVKVRGQRLELGEVEYQVRECLSAHVGVEVVAETVTPAGEQNNPILVAFLRIEEAVDSLGYLEWDQDEVSTPVTSETEQQHLATLVAQIQARLLLVLPAYAIPSIYIPLRLMPLSVSGKTDRKRLRCIAAELSLTELAWFSTTMGKSSQSLQDIPSTPLERQLQYLWADVLGVSPVAIKSQDSFLQLGGSSTLAIGLVAAARAAGLQLTFEIIFRHPTLWDMARLTTNLANYEDERLDIAPFALLKHGDNASCLCEEASIQCKIDKNVIEDIYPCSPMQQGLMALSIKEDSAYILRLVYSLPYTLDLNGFKTAWEHVAKVHSILRTRFFVSGDLYQAVLNEPLQWIVIENKALESHLLEDKRAGMHMGQPMSRFAVSKNSISPEWTFVWTVHHSMIDGWSLPEIIRNVEQAYVGRSVAPAQSFNYFIRFLSTRDMEASKMFWGRQLIDAPPPTFPMLPPTYRSLGNAYIKHEVSLLRQPQTSITTATMIKAAWTLLVGMYSSTTDVVFGLTLSGRTAELPGIEHIAGPTIATVPFRTQFKGNQLITDLLTNVQEHYIDIIPFEQLGLHYIKCISAEAEAACDFRSLLVIQSTPESALDKSTPRLLSSKQDISIPLDYPLVFECELSNNSINVRATFDDTLLNVAEVQRITHQFEHLLQQICLENPAMTVSGVQTACPADIEEIFKWNSTKLEALEACVHDLIREQTQNQPDHPAICSWDGELSYGKLDELSSVLASHLAINANIGPESLVPVCFEKSKWAVVAMLAILKAGAACVPMDPKQPVNRLRRIIENIGQKTANIVLTTASNAHLFGGIKPTVIVGPYLLSKLPTKPLTNIKSAGARNVAFVLYTSGSTGVPKGIVVEHMALCTSAREHGPFITLGNSSRVLQFAAYTFDISIGDIFVTLIHGGCICIPSEHDRMNNLAGAINSMNVNHANLTPTVASQIQPGDVKGLKVLVVAGEPMTREVVERWAENVTLIEMYGPAECTIYCMGRSELRRDDHPSNIGHGVGSIIWITNPENSNILTPIGGIGELLIEGPTLARGYLNDELNTSQAFIEDPLWIMNKASNAISPRRLYRSGDLGRYNFDGSISFVGRRDRQVKLRGQRIELGEVEYHLRANLPVSVEATALVTTHDRPALAAFLTIEESPRVISDLDGIASSPAQLETFQSLTAGIETKLRSVLPSYMVPSLFIPVLRIPLNISGKTDYKKLQQMIKELSLEQVAALRNMKTDRIPPSTAMEQRLHDLWTSVLKVTEVGVQDNFFNYGDSITAMRLVAAARKEGLSLTVDKIFKTPVLSELALITCEESLEYVTDVAPFSLLSRTLTATLKGEVASQCQVSIDQIEDIYPCTPQQAFWIWDTKLQGHQAQMVYSLPASLDMSRFYAAWEAVFTAYTILRTRIIHTSSGYFQVVIRDSIEWSKETSLDSYLKEDRPKTIGLGQRLQRYCVIEDDLLKGRYFVWTAQHSSYDGWSLYLLFKELGHAYHYGFSVAKGAKFNQYIKTLKDMDQDAASTFWQSQMAGAFSKPLFVVPDGYQTFPNTQWKREITLPKLQKSSITISTMIEVAWALVFSRALKCEDIILDILRAGRTIPLPGIEELIAPTTTAVPLRIHINPKTKTHTLLSHVQQQLNSITPFEHLGFSTISALNDEVTAACKNAIRINIAPPVVDESPAQRIDMPLIWAELALILPFRLDLAVNKNVVDVEAVFDKALISPDRVDQLLRQFEQALLQISRADAEQQLRDIDLSGISDKESSLIESISAESGRVRERMLTSPQSRAPFNSPTTATTGSFIIGSW